jgi:hypothetical protein
MRWINVEVAAPQDVSRERELVLVAIEEANQLFREADLDIHLRRATTDPEIVIGIFWWQFSTEAQDLILRGLDQWREHSKPFTIVFFNRKPYAPTESRQTLECSKVLDLQHYLSELGLAEAFVDDDDFVRKVGASLKRLARQIAIDNGIVEFRAVDSPSLSTPRVIPDAFTCSVLSTMRTVRAEGLTELVGEIGLIFSGGTPVSRGGSIHSLKVELYLNTRVTNRIDDTGLCDAVLVRNDRFAGNTEIPGRVYANLLTFDKVTVEAPGANDTLSFSIRNIRVNAWPLSMGADPNAKVLGHIKVSPESIVTVNSSVQDLALVRPALKFSVVKPNGPATGRKISDVFIQSLSADGEALGFLRFASLQDSAFMPRASERTENDVEASTGTRLKAVMNNIPAGVRILVSIANYGGAEKARLLTAELGPYREQRASNVLDGIPVAEMTIDNGSASAVWEVIASDLHAGEVLDFAAFLKYDAHPEANVPAPGLTTVVGSLAPAPPSFLMGRGAGACFELPIPRFAASNEPATRWFVVEPQRTSLLFPVVSNQEGLDTSITISNVSADPLDTPPQRGNARLYFYGANAPDACDTGSIAAGQLHSLQVSQVAPGFHGYVIARCAFAPARGFAIISGLGNHNFVISYLAEIIDVGENKTQLVQAPARTRQVSTLEVDSIPGELEE